MATTKMNAGRGEDTRERIYRVIVQLSDAEGRPPTQHEICMAAGVSVGSLLHHLPRLEGEGRIVRKSGPRGIIPLKRGDGSTCRAASPP